MNKHIKSQSVSPGLLETTLDIEDTYGRKLGNGSPYHKIEHQNSKADNEVESPLIFFISPVFVFLRWIGFTHYRFQFDPSTQTFNHHSGSRFRQILCLFIQILAILHSYTEEQTVMEKAKSSSLYAMYKLMSVSYLAFGFSFFRAMMTKGQNFQEIFTFAQGTTNIIRSAGCVIPCQRAARRLSIGLLIVNILFALLYTTVGVNGGEQGIWEADKVSKIIPSLANQFIQCYSKVFSWKNTTEIMSYDVAEEHSFFLVALLAILYTWLGWIVCLTWTMAFLMNTVFGLMFWKVLNNFFLLVRNYPSRNTLEDLRKFNSVTGIIDLYNVAFGWVTFTGVTTASIHFSVYIMEMFKETVPILVKICIGWSFVLFGIQLLAAAQVNQKASEIVDTLKSRYQMESVWKEFHGNCVETTQGILLVQHEVTSNKIGFRGLGFFTVTYTFLGTVLSVISTYSVVVMQIQNSS